MEAHEVFLFLLIAAVSIFLLQKMVKSILTVAGITVFILFLYMVFSGQLNQFFNPPVKSVFQRHDIFFLYDNYCCDRCTNIERPVCSCIVLPVYEGILDRSTDEDLIEFEFLWPMTLVQFHKAILQIRFIERGSPRAVFLAKLNKIT